MHNINRPFDAREKDMRDRLEVMIGRLEDAIRTLNDVAGVVDEEEADLVGLIVRTVGERTCLFCVSV